MRVCIVLHNMLYFTIEMSILHGDSGVCYCMKVRGITLIIYASVYSSCNFDQVCKKITLGYPLSFYTCTTTASVVKCQYCECLC